MSYLIGAANHIALGTALWDEDRASLFWDPQYGYCYHGRGPQGRAKFFELWPPPRMSCGDPTSASPLLGTDSGDSGAWSPWQIGASGKRSYVYITGQCLDGTGAPLAGATVKGFRTSDSLYVGQTTSDSNGNYSLGSPYVGVNHYLVAYEAGSPDVLGTTVNTLTPS
jgi:hypothetical protein